jgi:hypothetical protein
MTNPQPWLGTSDRYSSGGLIRTEQPHWCEITVYHSEDWHDLVPQFSDAVTGGPVNLAALPAREFDLWVRPSANHPTLIEHLSSSSGGITIDNLNPGRISFHRTRNLVDEYPLGRWEQWLSLAWIDADYGPTRKMIWAGPFIVHPGRYTAPAIVDTSMGAGGGDMLGAGGGNTIGVD